MKQLKYSGFISDAIATILAMLFLYTSISKYLTFDDFKWAMENQPFPKGLSWLLILFLPPLEIALAVLLFLSKTRALAFRLTIGMMTVFTVYIAIISLHVFRYVPCSCGGFIQSLSWHQHLVLNGLLLIMAITGQRAEKDSKAIKGLGQPSQAKIFHARNQVNTGPAGKTGDQ